jgi:type VI secretion system protein ImpM
MDVGLYGKLPSHGDFLRRRVDNEFIGVWDAWLQECIATSRAELGDDWLNIYLTSPAWRFVCDAGVCGNRVYAGVMVPSVDRVGRYFPLTLMWAVPADVTPFAVARIANGWFDTAERLIVEALATDRLDFEEFDRQLLELSESLAAAHWQEPVMLHNDQAALAMSDNASPWQIPLGAAATFVSVTEQLLTARLRDTHHPLVMLWTEGSSAIEPSCLFLRGLPQPHTFASLLDGSWPQHGWSGVGADVMESTHTSTLVSETVPLGFRSAALSDVGKARSNNQDAFLERPEIGLWVVADGMGGHRDGDLASRMVCDAMANVVPGATLDDTIEDVQQRLQDVNAHLYRAATRLHDPIQSGTTAVVLLVRGDQCAILWVGDSRVYRLRAGQLAQLTTDHSWAAEAEADDADDDLLMSDSNVITRAVGGEESLMLDVHLDQVRPGDRFLLCSDGLTRPLDDAEIARILQQNNVSAAAHNLIASVLSAGAPDNVTVIVAEAYAQTFDSDTLVKW